MDQLLLHILLQGRSKFYLSPIIFSFKNLAVGGPLERYFNVIRKNFANFVSVGGLSNHLLVLLVPDNPATRELLDISSRYPIYLPITILLSPCIFLSK